MADEALTKLLPSSVCTGRRTDGEACRKLGIRGSSPSLCVKHGGALPSMREKAARRVAEAQAQLASLAPKIVTVWREAMDSPDPAVKLKAANDAGKFVFDQKMLMDIKAEVAVVESREAVGVEIRRRLDKLAERKAEIDFDSGLPEPPLSDASERSVRDVRELGPDALTVRATLGRYASGEHPADGPEFTVIDADPADPAAAAE